MEPLGTIATVARGTGKTGKGDETAFNGVAALVAPSSGTTA
jgi:hypothetical protein